MVERSNRDRVGCQGGFVEAVAVGDCPYHLQASWLISSLFHLHDNLVSQSVNPFSSIPCNTWEFVPSRLAEFPTRWHLHRRNFEFAGLATLEEKLTEFS